MRPSVSQRKSSAPRSFRPRSSQPPSAQLTLVHSYLFLRRAIGIIGLGLPAVLVIGKLLLQGGAPLDSISDYYYSDLRGVFVGSMCAVGVFLLSYRGYALVDDILSDVAGVAAIVLALFPTTPSVGTPTGTEAAVGTVHIVSAAIFFTALIGFCFFLFTRTDSPTPTGRKQARNGVYRACGAIMLASLIAAGLVEGVFHAGTGAPHWILWLESTAVMAFGVAWLVKGETLLTD